MNTEFHKLNSNLDKGFKTQYIKKKNVLGELFLIKMKILEYY